MTNDEKLRELDQCWQELSWHRFWRNLGGVSGAADLAYACGNFYDHHVVMGVIYAVVAVAWATLCGWQWIEAIHTYDHKKSLLEVSHD